MKRLRLSSEEKELFFNEVKTLVDKGEINRLKDLSGIITQLDAKNITKPTVYIMSDVMAKMEALVKHSSTEISWHCLVKRDKEQNCYLIYDILLFPQTNTGTATTTDQDEYAEWLSKLLMDPDESKFDDLRMHGHSHVNMSVYSSTVDDGYQTDILTNIKDDDYYIFMILNKKHDICTLIYDYHRNVLFENADITIEIVTQDKTAISVWAENRIKEFCKKPSYKVYNNPYTNQVSIELDKANDFEPKYKKYLRGGR